MIVNDGFSKRWDIMNNNVIFSRHRSERRLPWMPAFALGFAAASLVWNSFALFYYRKILSLQNDEDESDDGSDGSGSSKTDAITSSLMRWPWDRFRKTICNSVLSPFFNLELFEKSSDSPANVNDKRGPCIGEIFGLDVGGTLTKLVYFEEQAHEYKRIESHEQGLNRRERYTTAASAREVLQARRENKKLHHHTDSDADLQGLIGARQESVPDRLDKYGDTYQTNATSRENGQQDKRTRIGMKRSRSMSTLSKPMLGKKEALDNFYSFARRLDTYETAVKDKHLSFYSKFLQGTFHFIRFETRRMENAMNLMRYNDFHLNIKEIGATGGGAHKFAEMWDTVLGISMAKQDEMDSLVAGMQFVLADIDGECYTFKPCDWVKDTFDQVVDDGPLIGSMLNSSNTQNGIVASNDRTRSLSSFSSDWNVGEGERSLRSHASAEEQRPRIDQWWTSKKVEREPAFSDLYPYLLVSIGTGVSILRVDGPRKHERISGSTIGGGTYWGLCRLLTGSDSFSAVLDLASKGDPSKVDMMVGDIYGEGSNALEKLGLRSDIVASSFGKLVTKQNPSEGIKEEDLARALLLMVTNNIGQVAHLNAKLYKTSRIYFIGTFLQHNIISQQRLAYSIDYWSQGQMEALFLKHEAYFGALGAFLLNQGIEHKKQVAPPIKTRKRRHPTRANVSHQRSKSMGSIQL